MPVGRFADVESDSMPRRSQSEQEPASLTIVPQQGELETPRDLLPEAVAEAYRALSQLNEQLNNVSRVAAATAAGIDHYNRLIAGLTSSMGAPSLSFTVPSVGPLPQFRHHFDRIGRTSVGEQAAEKSFWQSGGPSAIEWLIARFREPGDLRYVWALSALLADLAPAAIDPIISHLEAPSSYDESLGLLDALVGVDPSHLQRFQGRISAILTRFLDDPDDALRLAAVAATSVLGSHVAERVLSTALETERQPDVQRSLLDQLAERREP